MISLREGNSFDLVAALRSDLSDVAILRPEAVELVDLRVHELDEEVMVAALPSSHPAATDRQVNLSALVQEAFVLTPRELGPTLFDAAIAACRDAGFEPRLGQSVPQIASVLALVAAELGVSLLPQSIEMAMVQGVTYCALEDVRQTGRTALVHRRADRSRGRPKYLS